MNYSFKRSHRLTSDGQMGHIRNSVSFTIVNSKMRKVTVARKLKYISGVQFRMRVMLKEKNIKTKLFKIYHENRFLKHDHIRTKTMLTSPIDVHGAIDAFTVKNAGDVQRVLH